MLKKTDTSIEVASATILNAGYDVAFLVPTETAMNKSIMDAHDSVRAFLKRNEIHNYAEQEQGPKRYITAQYITSTAIYEKTVSLYRPETKKGDPRIWIYDLKALAKPQNLLALICSEGKLFIVNCSNAMDLNKALKDTIPKPRVTLNETASELLQKLKVISNKGFVPSFRQGDTGIGMTLETLLRIPANSSKLPDYKGIEIKAARISQAGKQNNKNQLFSKTPNWKLSPIGTAEQLVMNRGYVDSNGQNALRHTVSGDKPNSCGLYMDVDYANDHLRQMFTDVNDKDFSPEHDMTWVFNDLRRALQKKHRETFWVKALHQGSRESEEFHYVEVQHTANPFINNLETLFETGLVTMDYTLHIKPTGKTRDHGYLFKLKANSIEALFPKPLIYDLRT